MLNLTRPERRAFPPGDAGNRGGVAGRSLFVNIAKDASMNDLIAILIRSSTGYMHETAGVIIGFFNDPAEAHRCADQIAAAVGKIAEVCGSQLSVSL